MHTTTSPQEVTSAQLAACTRLVDEHTCETFYRVHSAHMDKEYEVRFVPDDEGCGHSHLLT